MTSAPVHVLPDAKGRFGAFGGRYVPETLVAPLEELEAAYAAARKDKSFHAELNMLLRDFAGRPTPLQYASRLTELLGGPKIYLKREDNQPVFSFKLRGAYNKMAHIPAEALERGVITASAGNHIRIVERVHESQATLFLQLDGVRVSIAIRFARLHDLHRVGHSGLEPVLRLGQSVPR